MPMPRVGDRVHVVINPGVLLHLDQLAERSGMTRSEIMRRLLSAALAQPDLVALHVPTKLESESE